MSPRIWNMTAHRFRKLRQATLAAFLGLASIDLPSDQLDLSLSALCPAPVVVATPDPVRPSLPSIDFDITSEDARITCHNTRRGTTAEFLVETLTHGNLAGKRVVSVLEGGRWVSFAFADDFGLSVWTRKRGAEMAYERFAAFLVDLAGAMAKGVVIEIERI
jgi:hypothetical protein